MDNKTFERFAERIEPQENGCWIWTGTITGKYPVLWVRAPVSKNMLVHVLTYDHFRGPYVKKRYWVLDHTCEDKNCVNPWHLEHVSQSENIKRIHFRQA